MIVQYNLHNRILSYPELGIMGTCWFFFKPPRERVLRLSECYWIVPGTCQQ